MSHDWTRHLVYRTERYKTTWKLRLGLPVVVGLGLWLTSGWWTQAVGRSLVCSASVGPSDAILVDNFDPDYLLFERANRLVRAGFAKRVLVLVHTDAGTSEINDVSLGMAEVMARIARVGPIEPVPFREAEPITLNAARDVQRFLEREHIRSALVATPLFRSRRAALIYGATLGRAGVTIHCQPVPGGTRVENWAKTWHGIQEVLQQWIKLQYYRFWVLPFAS